MEVILSAFLGELAARSVSFFTSRYSKPAVAVEDNLQRILLRAEVIVEEAAGRHVTNRAMLRQLNTLRHGIYRGHYVLDTFGYQAHQEDEAEDQVVSHSSAFSKLTRLHATTLCRRSTGSRQAVEDMQEVLHSLNTMILDATELTVFLKNYPCLYRQPYSMHLLLEKCIFGRQMEMQLVINFLLHTQTHGHHVVDVLPIVGPGRVGKSTLVAHVCKDERICEYFSQIVFLREEDFKTKLSALRDKCVVTHQNSNIKKNGRFLIIAEVGGDLDEDAWKILCSMAEQYAISKIIITSRSKNITKFSTVQALTLKHMSDEAYWYFFKLIAFGSTDPKMHPRLAYLAMEMAKILAGSFTGANVYARLLRENFNMSYWFKVLAVMRGYLHQNLSKFGKHTSDLLDENKSSYLGRLGRATEYLLVHDQYETCSSQEIIPMMKIQDVVVGSVNPHGIFDVLAWKSPIPPYRNYIYTCEIRELQPIATYKRKRSPNY